MSASKEATEAALDLMENCNPRWRTLDIAELLDAFAARAVGAERAAIAEEIGNKYRSAVAEGNEIEGEAYLDAFETIRSRGPK